jgi:hypothetical protein
MTLGRGYFSGQLSERIAQQHLRYGITAFGTCHVGLKENVEGW